MRDRSPGFKLFLAGLVGLALLIPLLLVYGLVSDRQEQARIAERAITAGSGGAQIVSGPVLVVPYDEARSINDTVDGRMVTRTQRVRKELFLSPARHSLATVLDPERKKKALYETVIYIAKMQGKARFELPADLATLGLTRDQLRLEQAQLRFGISDTRGLRAAANVRVNGRALALVPGGGLNASKGAGFSGPVVWTDGSALAVDYSYTLRGSQSLTLVPRGGRTDWRVTSSWQHPDFGGSFLPDESRVSDKGFSASWSIGTIALNQPVANLQDPGPPVLIDAPERMSYEAQQAAEERGTSKAASIGLIEPADIYAQVDRSVKYGFLFIGFTFVTFLLFDVVGGARVAAAEYLLTGAGLVLFFVLLLAFAEWTGFGLAYVIASAAIIGLLTAYSAAVLGGWKRASFIGVMLTALYGVLYVLLSLEAASLIVGSLLMFMALAGVMYATRNVNWSEVTSREERFAD